MNNKKLKDLIEFRRNLEEAKRSMSEATKGFEDENKIKINNEILIRLDSEALIMCMDKRFGGLNKNLSEISYLEFRSHMHKRYYKKKGDTI